MTLREQFLTLFLMAGCGIGLGIGFDVIGTAAREFRMRGRVRALLDVLYWAAATLVVFRVLLYANNGQVRPFVFLGLAVGVLLYALLLGKAVRHVTGAAIRLVKRIVRLVLGLLRAVVLRPVMLLIRLLRTVAVFLLGVSVYAGKIVVQWIKSVYVWTRRRFRRD